MARPGSEIKKEWRDTGCRGEQNYSAQEIVFPQLWQGACLCGTEIPQVGQT